MTVTPATGITINGSPEINLPVVTPSLNVQTKPL